MEKLDKKNSTKVEEIKRLKGNTEFSNLDVIKGEKEIKTALLDGMDVLIFPIGYSGYILPSP